mgnify:CR=1 FL=1
MCIRDSSRVVSKLEIPLLSEIPLIGKALFGQPWPFLFLYIIVPFAWWLVYRTRWGLEVRAAGENPQASDVSGIDVNKRRRQSIYFAGLCSGLGGAYLLLGQVGRFDDGIVAGRGFIAIVAVIFGGWTLRGTIFGCLLFGSGLFCLFCLVVLSFAGKNMIILVAGARGAGGRREGRAGREGDRGVYERVQKRRA